MSPEDVLQQRAEIQAFLETLIIAHRKLLLDVQDTNRLEKVRKDILICFNDMCTLNGMLTSLDGDSGIRGQLQVLEKWDNRLEKLGKKEQSINKEMSYWQLSREGKSNPKDNKSETFTIRGNYHEFLNKYIDIIGIANTSLAEQHTDDDETHEMDKSELANSIVLLEDCNDQITSEITQLESLLQNFRKDQEFIFNELKRCRGKMDSILAQFEEELADVRQSQKKILMRLGLLKNKDSSITTKMWNLSLDKNYNDNEFKDALGHAHEFISMKIGFLHDQLGKAKEETHRLQQQRNFWEDCLGLVGRLESSLREKLVSNPNTPPVELLKSIWQTISQLKEISSLTECEDLQRCVDNEIEVLERACEELDSTQKAAIPNAQPSSNKEKNPEFLVKKTSPPKAEITKETIPPLSNSFVQLKQSNSFVQLKQSNSNSPGKLQKED